MNQRFRRIAPRVLLGVVLFVLVLGVVMRLLRHKSSAPETTAASGIVRVRNLFTDLYGVRVGERIAIFDAGIDGEGNTLDSLIRALGGKSREEVTDVFLTHGHFDHVAEAPLCKNARIHVGREDVEMLAARAPAEPWAARWFSILAPSGPIDANAPLEGPKTVPLGEGKEVLALPFPGHTRGSYVYVFDGVLIAGDSLNIDGDRLEFAIGFVSVDLDANRRSAAHLREALAGHEIHTVCTGHQGCTPPGRGGSMLDVLIKRAAAP